MIGAATYVVLAALSPGNLGQHLHTGGPYFTVTVFSIVGFGDITAKTEKARLVVTGQMIADLAGGCNAWPELAGFRGVSF